MILTSVATRASSEIYYIKDVVDPTMVALAKGLDEGSSFGALP